MDGRRETGDGGRETGDGGRETGDDGRGRERGIFMKKIENRAVVCFLLALALAAGMAFFLFRYLTQGGSWASAAFNRHLYNSQGQLTAGTVLDRGGGAADALAEKIVYRK